MDDILGRIETLASNDHLQQAISESEEEISQEDVWVVIDEFFRKKGLVGQQLDSFDEFVQCTLQSLIDDSGKIIAVPENQFQAKNTELDQVKYTLLQQLLNY